MRLLDNSTTRNLFESLKESYDCGTYEEAAQQAAEEIFDTYTDDIFLNNTIVKTNKETDEVTITCNVSAYGGDPDENGDIEMNRDFTVTIPLDYTADREYMSIDEFYETACELLKQWVLDHHDGPESFYESAEVNNKELEKELWDAYLDIASDGDLVDYDKVIDYFMEENKDKNYNREELLNIVKKLDKNNFNQAMELFNGKEGYIKEFGQEAYDNWVAKLGESVMINTGSTTVTSDETGVTIEDNGNTITSGNGVTVDIDNEDDVLPAEMDIAEPTDEVPTEPVEELPIDEPVEELPEELPEEPIEGEETDEDLDESEGTKYTINKMYYSYNSCEDIDYGLKNLEGEKVMFNSEKEAKDYLKQKGYKNTSYKEDGIPFKEVYKIVPCEPISEEVLEKKDNETEEEVNNSKVEECDKTDKKDKEKIEETADGYNQNQNVEIYQNPEFDYQILDITELDNTDTGDIRAIDMANILNDLDESLTEATGTNNWGEINSFLTRKGTHKKTNESYSSAILELTLPRLNESIGEYKNVFMLEVYGDGALKECVVRNSKSQIIKEYCGKTKDPVKHFEGVIFDIMNSRMINEAVEPMVNEPYEDKGMNFADGKAIDKDVKRQEKHLKQHADKNKEKEFKVEKEPDQENTAGKTEEELTDTADVEALPKAKKTKVDAEKIKVKEIKESVEDAKSIIMDEGEPEILNVDEYTYVGPANKFDSMNTYYDLELPEWLRDELSSYGDKIIELSCGDHYPECYDKENCSIVREVPTDEYVELLRKADVPSRGGQEFGEELKQRILSNLGESVKLTEAEDELLDEPIVTDGTEPEDELEESGSDVAIFHRKPASVDAMRAAEQNGITVNKSNYKIIGTKELSGDEFDQFANHLSSEDYDWLKEYNDTSNSGEFKCVEVINTDDDSFSILVDPQGYAYARYAAIKDNLGNEEELLEPEEEILEEPIESEEDTNE